MLKKANKFTVFLLDLIEISFIAVAVFVLVWAFVGQPLEITGDSMEPTLHNQEQIISEKISGNFSELKRGQIVVFKHPDRPDVLVIKRVVGLPQEKLEIKDGGVYINDNLLEEPYTKGEVTYGSEVIHSNVNIIIPSDHYVLFGDNRSNSTDSRKWGTIPEEDIVGRGFIVFYPITNIRIIDSNFGVQNALQAFRSVIAK